MSGDEYRAPDRLDEADYDALEAYIAARARDLGLGRWRIILERDDADTADDATIWIAREAESARLQLSPSFRDLSREKMRDTLIHELLHVHLEPVYMDLLLALEEATSSATYAVAKAMHRRAFERQVEALARQVARAYPLVELPEREGPDAVPEQQTAAIPAREAPADRGPMGPEVWREGPTQEGRPEAIGETE